MALIGSSVLEPSHPARSLVGSTVEDPVRPFNNAMDNPQPHTDVALRCPASHTNVRFCSASAFRSHSCIAQFHIIASEIVAGNYEHMWFGLILYAGCVWHLCTHGSARTVFFITFSRCIVADVCKDSLLHAIHYSHFVVNVPIL